MTHRTTVELDAALDHIRQSPADHGTLRLIVRRPQIDQREALSSAELNLQEGLAGDTWIGRPSRDMADGSAHPEKMLTIMNIRVAELIAGSPDRVALAGDQLYVDLDISAANLPAGTQLAIGSAVVEVTEPPHNGCAKFTERFGLDAHRWVNSPDGKQLKLRGVNAKVVTPGTVTAGDVVTKLL